MQKNFTILNKRPSKLSKKNRRSTSLYYINIKKSYINKKAKNKYK